MNEELLPCPFCGGAAHIKRNKTVMVSCSQCTASSFQVMTDSKSSIDAWNRRAALAAPASTPQGYKLVPLFPTPEMMQAFQDELSEACGSFFEWSSGGDEAYAAMLAAAPVAQPAAQGELELDAARWRAFIGSARIKMQGSAGLSIPLPNNYAHLGMEIWTTYDRDYTPELLDQMDKGNAQGREWLTKYANIAIEAQRVSIALQSTAKTAEGE